MLQSRELLLFPTSRALRAKVKELLSSDAILPKMLTIGEFEKKSILVKDRVFIDDDTRVLLLREASDFENFKELQIDRDFFIFLKNSKFIFSFFDELAMEKLDIDALRDADIYASFVEHLDILKLLRDRYIKLLDKHNYCDKVLLPSLYELNHSFLSNFDKIVLYLEGYLSNFEFEIFKKISQNTTLIIDLYTNEFNQKMIEKFNEIGFNLKRDFYYKIDLSNKEIISSQSYNPISPIYKIFPSTSRMLQVAFVKKSIYDFLKEGVEPKEIVIVLPDGSFAEFLELMDDELSFNFAMGKSFTRTPIYRRLFAVYEYMSEPSIENRARLDRESINYQNEKERFARYKGVIDLEDIEEEFLYFIGSSKGEEVDIYKRELHLFSKLFSSLQHYKFQHIIHLFLNRLKSATIDDKSGGKITVMEVLESRGVSFEGVIVVDFNDGIVPAKSSKDIFLSTDLRAKASLPTQLDRENLQKYYYKRLFDRAKFVNISYVNDEQSSASRFIEELGIKSDSKCGSIENYHNILFINRPQKPHKITQDLYVEWDFSKIKLSSSALKDYLDCKRRYYFKYIRSLKEAKIPTDERSDKEIGIYIHSALSQFYSKQDSLKDSNELLLYLQKELYQRSEGDLVLRFYIDIWLERLKSFVESEIEHFKRGYKVIACEKEFNTIYNGFHLTGKIDRIDRLDDKYIVIDYKSGKIPQTSFKKLKYASDFQLQFYEILVSKNLGFTAGSYYYDLRDAKLIEDEFKSEKFQLLDSHLESLKDKNQNFSMCEDRQKCKFCPYRLICDRVD